MGRRKRDRETTCPHTLWALAYGAHQTGNSGMERSACQLLLEDHGVEVRFLRRRPIAQLYRGGDEAAARRPETAAGGPRQA
jgi:hypothetical protein